MSSMLFVVLTGLSSVAPSWQGNGVSPVGTGGSHVIQGQVYLPSGRRAENVHVKLQSFGAGDLSVMASGNGEFTFRSLSPGQYIVIIDAGKGFERAEENVFIDTDIRLRTGSSSTSRPYRVIVHLQPKRNPENEGKASVVNAAALAEAPEPAQRLYKKALGLAQAGDSKKAVENLKSAISIFPNFVMALDELGVQYLKLSKADEAVQPLREAVKISPDAFRPNLNLGIALLEAKQFEEAESQLKSAIRLSGSSSVAHMYLGIALISERKLSDAQTELETAVKSDAPELAKAHYYLGGIYWGNREYNRAADELDTYLRLAPNAPEGAKVRETINELRSKE